MNKKNIKQEVQSAIEDMQKKISRDSKHIYRNNETGEMLQGVSTVSSIVPKDWLAAWGAKETVKALGFSDYGQLEIATEMWEKIKSCPTVKEYHEILKEAKGASSRKSKKAMVDGTLGHKWLEDFVQAKITAKDTPKIPLGTPLERPIVQFLAWELEFVDYWMASEALVTRLDKSYAGQLDAICMLKSGELALVDFKFASHIDIEYHLQTGGYAATFEPYGINFDKRIIIRLPKTLEQDDWDAKEFKYKKIPNNIEAYIVPTHYIGDRDAFFAALIVKKWINYATKK